MIRDYVYLNEWYEELGIDTVPEGYEYAWTTCMMMDYYWQVWLDFDHEHIITDDGQEYIKIEFWQHPIKDFADYC